MKDGCVKARKIHKTQSKKVEFQPISKTEKEHGCSVFKKQKPGHLT